MRNRFAFVEAVGLQSMVGRVSPLRAVGDVIEPKRRARSDAPYQAECLLFEISRPYSSFHFAVLPQNTYAEKLTVIF